TQLVVHNLPQPQQSQSAGSGNVRYPTGSGRPMLNQLWQQNHTQHILQVHPSDYEERHQLYQQHRLQSAQLAHLQGVLQEHEIQERVNDNLTETKMREREQQQKKLDEINEYRRRWNYVPLTVLPRADDFFGKLEFPQKMPFRPFNHPLVGAGIPP